MRLVIQRVERASVTIEGNVKARIESGLLVFVGVTGGDTVEDVEWLSHKLVNLRIFDDGDGVMNQNVIDTGGEVMIISQFTLYAMTKKGNRPSYINAAKPDVAVPLYESFVRVVKEKLGKSVATGEFGADMKIELLNDGPVTIWMDSKNKE